MLNKALEEQFTSTDAAVPGLDEGKLERMLENERRVFVPSVPVSSGEGGGNDSSLLDQSASSSLDDSTAMDSSWG